ncbi:MAG: DUF3006 domain-containing protein [Oscillospiraceae bacterium]|jgi:hypothetical protein|nr:DUF3006 domain-containing protein [Oscillospiraceae bacterium]
MNYIVDRIEGEFAVCEDAHRTMRHFSLDSLPFPIQEGTCFEEENGVCSPCDDERRERIRCKMDRIWNR